MLEIVLTQATEADGHFNADQYFVTLEKLIVFMNFSINFKEKVVSNLVFLTVKTISSKFDNVTMQNK